MNTRIGTYITHKVAGESYKSYIPPPLPPNPPLDLSQLASRLEKATQALTELNSIHKIIPNTSLFIYYMYVRKEALLSNQIEGTQSSFSDLILFESQQKPEVSLADVEEVSNYVKAMYHGLQRLQSDFPLSLRLLREIHGILLSGSRGSHKSPGEFRQSQNWIGGTRPGNALFVPPSTDYLDQCLNNLEHFLHDESLPTLIKAGLVHVQFETIHPFLDGNGRLGRLLITLLLCANGILDAPILYLSLYLKQNRQLYYDLLQEVRTHGTWETWLEFFLDGVHHCAKQAVQTAERIHALFEADSQKIATLGRARFSGEQALEYLKRLPQVNAPLLANALNLSLPTARQILKHMTNLGILQEISGKKRDRVYLYRRYLDILEEGTEPLPRSSLMDSYS